MFAEQFQKMKTQQGFIAALDQSGGSTPKALKLYGVDESEYHGDEEMFNKVHEMRTRIITNPHFTGEKIVGAILFENTLDHTIDGLPSARFLWERKQIVPFLKVDKGLAAEENMVQLMKDIPGLDALLAKAKIQDVFGTKMRSVIKGADAAGIKDVVAQQFAVAKQIIAAGLVPIIEPEVDIHAPDKAEAETLLKAEIMAELAKLTEDQNVMLKLSLPTEVNFYKEFVEHPRVVRVVALSGGYERDKAVEILAQNKGVIASFSRALCEGLFAQQSEAEFSAQLASSIDAIYNASC